MPSGGVFERVTSGEERVVAEAVEDVGVVRDDAPEVRCFLLFLGALASIVQSFLCLCLRRGVRVSQPSAPGANAAKNSARFLPRARLALDRTRESRKPVDRAS